MTFIDNTIESLESRFLNLPVKNLELISELVDPKQALKKETISILANKYSSFVSDEKLIREAKYLKEIKLQYCILTKLEFAGILSANFEKNLPICSKLGDIYVTASNETANVEREFSKQNLTMTNLRNNLKIANMSHNKEY